MALPRIRGAVTDIRPDAGLSTRKLDSADAVEQRRRLHEEELVRDWMNSLVVRGVAEAGYTLEAMEREVMAPPCT